LYRGVEIRWACDPALIKDETPAQAVLHFPGGLSDFLTAALEGRPTVVPAAWSGEAEFPEGAGRVEWAASWVERGDGFLNTYANTIPTPQGGTFTAPGMTLRDYFAAKAMNALILEMADWKYVPETLAKYAYAQADAMLKARGIL
jgi:DNA gyrase/topoisomerase IV subunit B